jgi:hypothetical protein
MPDRITDSICKERSACIDLTLDIFPLTVYVVHYPTRSADRCIGTIKFHTANNHATAV